MHPSHMQREEASATLGHGYEHCRDYVWRCSQPSMREAHGEFESPFEADAVPLWLPLGRDQLLAITTPNYLYSPIV